MIVAHKTQTLWGLALSAGRYSIFGAITVKNWRNWKSWGFLVWGTYFGPLQTLFIIRTKFWYKKCDKLTKVPTGVKLGGFLGIWKISCIASVLRFKKVSYMPVLMSLGGVFHKGVKPPNSEKVFPKSVVGQWLPHLMKFIISGVVTISSYDRSSGSSSSSPDSNSTSSSEAETSETDEQLDSSEDSYDT